MTYRPDLSILICAYNMSRELPRTLQTLSPSVQRCAENAKWEVVVLDNGSDPPVEEAELQKVLPGVRVVRPEMVRRSPAVAINHAMSLLNGQLVALWIDGARMASPGVIRYAIEAWRADPSRVIGTLSFHLGPDVQMRTVNQGYDATTEDALLASVPWQQDGYSLFDISVLAGSSQAGWFGCIHETNGLFMDRKLWHALGGLDDNFKEPGGGFVNLDLWERAVALSNQQPWMILGEGTFHQVHGGAATSGSVDDRAKMHDEYVRIKGRQYAPPQYRACFVGRLDPSRPYQGFEKPLDTWRHAHSVRGRHFRVNMHAGMLRGIQHGALRTRYKGLRLCKSPFDLALYTQAIAQLRPTTIIEIGTSEGGSAAWFIDQCGCLGLTETRLITIDLAPPAIEIENVRMFRGDSLRPDSTFPTEVIEASGHPWLVIEDSAHTRESTLSVLEYFDRRLKPGDMLVIEDGVIADLEGQVYRVLDDGPNRAVAEFLDRKGDCYVIDTSFCDFYGHNLTWAPNAWLRRL